MCHFYPSYIGIYNVCGWVVHPATYMYVVMWQNGSIVLDTHYSLRLNSVFQYMYIPPGKSIQITCVPIFMVPIFVKCLSEWKWTPIIYGAYFHRVPIVQILWYIVSRHYTVISFTTRSYV